MQSVEKPLKLLSVFIEVNRDNLRIAELAKLSGLSKPAVMRIVNVLVKYGFLIQPESRGKYYLGEAFSVYNDLNHQKLELKQIALPHLKRLANEVDDCVALAVLDGEKGIIAKVVDTKHVLKIDVQENNELVLYATGHGKAILSCFNEKQLDGYFEMVNLVPMTSKTITDVDELKSSLAKVRKEGVAYDFGEGSVDVYNVSSSIKNAKGEVIASVGVISPSTRLTRAKARVISKYVKECADAISFSLG